MKLSYLKRKHTLLVGFDTKPSKYVAIIIEPKLEKVESDVKDWIDHSEGRQIGAIIYPFLFEENADKIKDFYLETVGSLLKEKDVVFINIPAEFVPFNKGPLIKTDKWLKNTLQVTLFYDDIKLLVLPTVQTVPENLEISTDVDIVVAEGNVLANIKDVFQVPFVVIIDKIETFTQLTGVTDVEERKEFSVTASKIERDAQTRIIAL